MSKTLLTLLAVLALLGIYYTVDFAINCNGTVVRGLWGLECINK